MKKKRAPEEKKKIQARLRGRVEGAHPRTDRYRLWRSRAEEDQFASETLLEKREVRKW
jgi:hypothetical protein